LRALFERSSDHESCAKIDKKNREKQSFALHDSNNFSVFEKACRRPSNGSGQDQIEHLSKDSETIY
jgi:hypothetical protein